MTEHGTAHPIHTFGFYDPDQPPYPDEVQGVEADFAIQSGNAFVSTATAQDLEGHHYVTGSDSLRPPEASLPIEQRPAISVVPTPQELADQKEQLHLKRITIAAAMIASGFTGYAVEAAQTGNEAARDITALGAVVLGILASVSYYYSRH